jgi:hypothetical protein
LPQEETVAYNTPKSGGYPSVFETVMVFPDLLAGRVECKVAFAPEGKLWMVKVPDVLK